MTRDEAIEALVRHEVAQLSPEQRESMLQNWWTLGAEDPDYAGLPEFVREALQQGDEPEDPQDSRYEPLLRLGVRRSFRGVLNTYLEERLKRLGQSTVVEGVAEELQSCPCCGYRSLLERGVYEICRVCFWEDDGTSSQEGFSGPNHMTLGEGRRNFDMIGAVDEASLSFVLRDGRRRYARGARGA